MGSYAEIWLGDFYIDSTKNDIDPSLMQLFRTSDKTVIHGKKNLPFKRRRWIDSLEADEEDVAITFYRVPITVLRDRLELRGYTLDVAKTAFTKSIRAQSESFMRMAAESTNTATRVVFERLGLLLEKVNADAWLAALEIIKKKGLKHRDLGNDSKEYEGTLIGYMLDFGSYGYSGPDFFVWLRLVIEICSDADELIYDVTDLILSGYFDSEDDLVEHALSLSSTDYSSFGKIIILTEGRSDSWIISESLQLLYPHLSDYFTFMDFEGARVGGGAGNLANLVKAFAGAGIINRMIALFDNDTAAEVATQTLRNVPLPSNILIMKLPELPALRQYPTIGPSGRVVMNVNGIAASIELYLGKDILTDDGNEIAPVQWMGYESNLKKYQGEVLFKDKVHDRFKKRLEACRKNRGLIETTDWTGICAIIYSLLVAFHDVDREAIYSLVEWYHTQ